MAVTETRVNREHLLHLLQSVEPGLSPKAIVEQSNCFIFKGGRVLTFNDEISCSAPSPVEGLEGAVVAEPLLKLLAKLEEDELGLSNGGAELVVTGLRRRSGITMEGEILLPVDHVERPKKGMWKPLHPEFCEAMAVVHLCAGQDESAFRWTCVHIHPDFIEACDDYQLCHWKMNTGVAKEFLLRQSSVKHVTSLGMTEFAETDTWVHFRNAQGVRLSCRRYDEDYPDISPMMGKEGATPLTLPKGLAEAAEKADIFSGQQENNTVTVTLAPGKLKIRGKGLNGWYEESKKAKGYSGPTMSFTLSPVILIDLVKRHNDCLVMPGRLQVGGGDTYTYVTSLNEPEIDKGPEEKGDEA